MWQNTLAVPNPTLAKLQNQLREKFPMARHGLPVERQPQRAPVNPRLPSTFPKGGITEVIPAHPAAGITLLLASLLEHEPPGQSPPNIALIDAADSFDPASFPPEDCSKLLWIRCQNPNQAMKAADLILRDGNVPKLVIDLLSPPTHEVRKIPATSWQRLNRLIESNDSSVIVFHRYPLIPCVRLRLLVTSRFTLDHFDQGRNELLQHLQIRLDLQRKMAL